MDRDIKIKFWLIWIFPAIFLLLGIVNRLFNFNIFVEIFAAVLGSATTISGVVISFKNDLFLSEKAMIEKARPSLGIIADATNKNTALYFGTTLENKTFFKQLFVLKNSDKIEFNISSIKIGRNLFENTNDFFVSKNQIVRVYVPAYILNLKECNVELSIATLHNLKIRKYTCLILKNNLDYKLKEIKYEN